MTGRTSSGLGETARRRAARGEINEVGKRVELAGKVLFIEQRLGAGLRGFDRLLMHA
jgi:hypothetical protein